jgi:hypothetical protein
MFRVSTAGDHNKTANALRKILRGDIFTQLDQYGQMGVAALEQSTPVDSRMTAGSWRYRIIRGRFPGIEWFNTNMTNQGTPVAILIQYGHATGTGGYVAGRDFINPAMRPVFDKIADDVWKKVKS